MSISDFEEQNNINKINENNSRNESSDPYEKNELLKFIENNHNNYEAYYKLGNIFYEEKNYDKAIEYFFKAGVTPISVIKLGNTYHIYRVLIGKSNKIIEKTSQLPNILQAYKNRGFSKFKLKKYDEAINDLCNLFLEKISEHEIANYGSSFTTESIINYPIFRLCNLKSLKNLTNLIVVDGDVNIPFYLGISYIKSGYIKYPEHLMNLVIKLDPTNVIAFYHLIRLQKRNVIDPTNLFDEANNYYSKALEMNPKHYEAIRYRGKIYFDFKKYEKALQDFEEISSRYNEDYEFLIDMGDTYLKLNRFYSAMKVYDQALEYKHFVTEDIKSALFDEYKKNKKKLLEETEDITANYYFAKQYFDSQIYDKSLVFFDKIIEIEPALTPIYYFRALYYFKHDRYNKAYNECKKAEKYFSNYSLFEIEKIIKENHEMFSDMIHKIKPKCMDYLKQIELPIIQRHINKLFPILLCTKCNDKNYKVLRPNTSFDGLEIECMVCKKKLWLKTDMTIPNEYIESIKDWIALGKPLEITLSSNYNAASKQTRIRIPSSIRQEVWRRDDGKCVNCGSRENLEYDHIIPVSKGGSNTARNIELLCQKCNREKTNKIL